MSENFRNARLANDGPPNLTAASSVSGGGLLGRLAKARVTLAEVRYAMKQFGDIVDPE